MSYCKPHLMTIFITYTRTWAVRRKTEMHLARERLSMIVNGMLDTHPEADKLMCKVSLSVRHQ
jgi:hypothetical protein